MRLGQNDVDIDVAYVADEYGLGCLLYLSSLQNST